MKSKASPASSQSATPTARAPSNPTTPAGGSSITGTSLPSATSLSQPTTGNISRAISACNRCRSRKTKCDQLFPACSACAKAGVECVGVDAATGREVPRSYVSHLEERVAFLESQLAKGGLNDMTTPDVGASPSAFPRKRKASDGDPNLFSPSSGHEKDFLANLAPELQVSGGSLATIAERGEGKGGRTVNERLEIDNLVDTVGMVSVQGSAPQSFLGSSSGISFAKLMFAAVKVSSKEGGGQLPAKAASFRGKLPTPWANKQQSFDSSSGGNDDMDAGAPPVSAALQTIAPRPPPAQFPDLDTASILADIYFNEANPQIPILHKPWFMERMNGLYRWLSMNPGKRESDLPESYVATLYFMNLVFAIATGMSSRSRSMPEEYHSAAMQYMDSIFSATNRLDGLKGVLLLAQYSMMRPAVPGVWYVLGSALRMCIDLGLHQETPQISQQLDALSLDERRRLFWCAYSLDRQVCVYLGRPFGISDDAIRVPFPEDVDDRFISKEGLMLGHPDATLKSSKTIACHMFRIRQLQSEIQCILYQQSELPRKFRDIDDWRKDMERRLNEWTITVPKSRDETNCGYNMGFIDLNYQQTRLLLYGLSPAVPNPDTEAYLVIADSGNRIIKAYRQLHREKSINYTWLACHNLFMAGTSYLCSLWHSPEVRRRTTIDQIDFNTLACVDVLDSMKERCPAAIGCRDVFLSLASATVQLCSSSSDGQDDGIAKRIKTEWSHNNGGPHRRQNSSSQASTFEPIQHALPTSLANIVHHVPSPPLSHLSNVDPALQQQQQSVQNITIMSPYSYSPPPIMRPPSVNFPQQHHQQQQHQQQQQSPDSYFVPSPVLQHQQQQQVYYQPVDHVMRAAEELSNDETYNIFSSGYQLGNPNGTEDMGGKVFQLMSEVGGGSIWGDQFIMGTGTGDSNGSNNGNGNAYMNGTGFGGLGNGNGGFGGNYVGFSGY